MQKYDTISIFITFNYFYNLFYARHEKPQINTFKMWPGLRGNLLLISTVECSSTNS